MTNLLIVGNAFTDEERSRLSGAHAAAFIGSPEEIAAMDTTLRTEVRAVAYKGHLGFGAEAMDALPNLGLIANYGVGYDSIDVAAATERGIKITNTPDVLNDDVADLAVGMMLAFSRDLMSPLLNLGWLVGCLLACWCIGRRALSAASGCS